MQNRYRLFTLVVLEQEVQLTGGEVVFRANEACSDLYIVGSHTVDTFFLSPSGEEKVRSAQHLDLCHAWLQTLTRCTVLVNAHL